jgi:hypothetical protein
LIIIYIFKRTPGIFNMIGSKVHPRTCHKNPEGEYRYISTPSLTSVLDEGGWSMQRPGCFTPGKESWYPFEYDKQYRNLLQAKNKIIVLVLFELVVVK